jgi:hypothetical protein
MFRAVHSLSSGIVTVFGASDLHKNVVTGRSQVWVGTGHFPLRLDYGRSPHAYVNQRLQIQLELLMMGGVPLETCCAVNEQWNNKFCCNVASCWLFLLSYNIEIRFAIRTDRSATVWTNPCPLQVSCKYQCSKSHHNNNPPDYISPYRVGHYRTQLLSGTRWAPQERHWTLRCFDPNSEDKRIWISTTARWHF